MAAARNTLLAKIYFDFDKSDLTDQGKATLDAKIPILNANPGLRIRSRGTATSADRTSTTWRSASVAPRRRSGT